MKGHYILGSRKGVNSSSRTVGFTCVWFSTEIKFVYEVNKEGIEEGNEAYELDNILVLQQPNRDLCNLLFIGHQQRSYL